MQAIYRCGHTKEFNGSRFERHQLSAIIDSYGRRDCPACRRPNPTNTQAIDIIEMHTRAEMRGVVTGDEANWRDTSPGVKS